VWCAAKILLVVLRYNSIQHPSCKPCSGARQCLLRRPSMNTCLTTLQLHCVMPMYAFCITQVTMFDAPMTERQLDYLRKVHKPVIARHNISQTHYDLMVGHLVDAMRTNGAQVRSCGWCYSCLAAVAWRASVWTGRCSWRVWPACPAVPACRSISWTDTAQRC
jgi:hypothetical protein